MDGIERRRTDWFAQFNGDPSKYTIFAELGLDGPTKLGYAPDGDLIAIKQYTKCGKDVIGLLLGIPHPNIVCAMGIKTYPDYTEVFQALMDTTLSQVLAAPLKFNEGQIATVCNEVRLPTWRARAATDIIAVSGQGPALPGRTQNSA